MLFIVTILTWQAAQGKPLVEGQPLFCVITKESGGGSVLRGTIDPAKVRPVVLYFFSTIFLLLS